MTASEYKTLISLNVANSTINQLICELANRHAEIDQLKAENCDLKEKLSPKPEATTAAG